MVRPSRPGPALTVVGSTHDRLLQHAPISVAFFFEGTLDAVVLAGALAQALERVPVFAGRLSPGARLEIACDGSGAAWSTARSGRTLAQVLDAVERGEALELVDMVDTRKARAERGPLLTARLAHLADGSSVLGVGWHHSVGDMHSFMLLMRAWSEAHQGRPATEALVVEDREGYLRQRVPRGGSTRPGLRVLSALDRARLVPFALWTLKRMQTMRVAFAPAEVAALKTALSEECGQRVSTNDAICAHLLEVVASFDGRARALALPINFRKRAGLDERLVGNLLSFLVLPGVRAERASATAARLRAAMNRFSEDHLDYHSTVDFVAARGGRLKDCAQLSADPLRPTLLVTNWTRFGVYDLQLGGHRPVHFTPVGDAPLPWLSGLVEGQRNEGLLWFAQFPRRLTGLLASPEGQRRLHRYRG
ncbi:MAG: hypothetical protein IT384_10200 [Deltaproteobacteria bacterium]|nr:hypothetical protein [Deltaproteobacteria bacterium]